MTPSAESGQTLHDGVADPVGHTSSAVPSNFHTRDLTPSPIKAQLTGYLTCALLYPRDAFGPVRPFRTATAVSRWPRCNLGCDALAPTTQATVFFPHLYFFVSGLAFDFASEVNMGLIF